MDDDSMTRFGDRQGFFRKYSEVFLRVFDKAEAITESSGTEK